MVKSQIGALVIGFPEGSVIPKQVIFAFLYLILFVHDTWAGEKLVYAVSHKGSDYTVTKTEIFSIDPETVEKQVIFSDENLAIVLLEKPYVFHFPVVAGGKLFAHAAERGTVQPFPGNAALYELSTDGSNLYRRICSVLGVESLGEIFVNTAGTRIGYINRMNQKQYIFIHDVVTGKLLSQVDITDTFLDCYASSIGWVPHSKKIFFSLETGDEHVTSEASYALVGTYFIDEGGRQLERLPAITAADGFSPPQATLMIGVLPTVEYLFETLQFAKQPSRNQNGYHYAVLRVRGDFSHSEDVSFSPNTKLYSGIRVTYRVSPSWKYLSAALLPVPSSAVSSEVWIKDLGTGIERAILSISTDPFQGPFLGLVGWLD